jgi:hypothetical protein
MELEKINFCNSNVYKINNNGLIQKTFEIIESILENKLNKNFFPGPQPVAVEKKDLELLKKKKYVVCEKSDGERYLLIIIYIENNPMCLLLNRNNDFFFVELNITSEMFEGTIFDGELIQTKNGNWNYLIHDCIAFNKRSYINIPHSKRYGAIIDFITIRYSYSETNPFFIKTKIFYEYSPDIELTWNHIQNTTENNIDGLIFTPIYSPIFFGRQIDLFKWKNGGNHTIDLLVKLVSNKIYTYYSNNKVFKKFDKNDTEFKKIVSFVENNELTKGIVLEFKVTSDNTLNPYRIRTDKNMGNSKLTIDNTFKNITESLEIQDLY